tara:strand:- start:29 stop:1120 length:1092 start_codon:yes stop_codon:yes gene_type:complete
MPHGGPHGAGFSRPSKAPTRAEIERTYDQALDRFIRQNQDKKQEQSSVKSVVADMPQKFQDFIARNTKDGRMNEAAKAIFRQYDDGRSQYSRDMNRMVQKSPEFAAARARRFPIETFIERMTPAAVGLLTGTPLGLGTLYDESRKLGSAAIGGLKEIAMKKGIIPRDDINPNTGTTSLQTDVFSPIQGPPAYDASGLAGYQDAIMRDLPPVVSFNPDDMNIAPAQPDFRFDGPLVVNPDDMMIPEARRPVEDVLPTDPVTEGLKTLFTGATPRDPRPVREQFSSTFQQPFDPPMILGGNPRGEVQSARLGALLGSDPNIAYGQEMNMLDVLAERARRGFNEGGLASINNPQYNMLMNASNFDI